MDPAGTIQEAIVRALDDLSDPAQDILVEAWAMTEFVLDDDTQIPAADRGPGPGIRRRPLLATDPCSNDTDHGKGYCYGPGGDAMCLACQVAWIERFAEPNQWVSIDVAA